MKISIYPFTFIQHSPSLWMIKLGDFIRGTVRLENDKTYSWHVYCSYIDSYMMKVPLSGGPGILTLTGAIDSAICAITKLS